jgi:hypothetical protein
VFFIGAGLSSAVGLPNTAALITEVQRFAGESQHWALSQKLPDRLVLAFKYFYPDAAHDGFLPDVVDFFSTLRTYLDVGSGHTGGFKDATKLYSDLRFAIGQMLVQRVRDAESRLARSDSYLASVVKPGNILITSNWDLVIERYAALHSIPLRLTGDDTDSVVLLKLHGSVDWCLGSDASARYGDVDFSALRERLFASHPYTVTIPDPRPPTDVLRVRALEHWNQAWARIKSRADELYMVTMVRGKSGDLGSLEPIWKDAYTAISRAKCVEIVGYSLPPDDIEIRALLRSGIMRGSRRPAVVVRNPAPDVHYRVRAYLVANAESDYLPVSIT